MTALSPVASAAAFGQDSSALSGDSGRIRPSLPVWDLMRVCTWNREPSLPALYATQASSVFPFPLTASDGPSSPSHPRGESL